MTQCFSLEAFRILSFRIFWYFMCFGQVLLLLLSLFLVLSICVLNVSCILLGISFLSFRIFSVTLLNRLSAPLACLSTPSSMVMIFKFHPLILFLTSPISWSWLLIFLYCCEYSSSIPCLPGLTLFSTWFNLLVRISAEFFSLFQLSFHFHDVCLVLLQSLFIETLSQSLHFLP